MRHAPTAAVRDAPHHRQPDARPLVPRGRSAAEELLVDPLPLLQPSGRIAPTDWLGKGAVRPVFSFFR